MNTQKSFSIQDTKGKLYLVPTPIGNLEDMTFRAVRLLQDVSLIASEDTRNTQKLLNHFDIKTKQTSLHEHNSHDKIPTLIELLNDGQDIAQVSDAGMPSISDPGHDLVVACIKEGISVVSIPGATAGMTALIASGLSPQPFYFHGFLPRKKKDQLDELMRLKTINATIIFYESPYRVEKTLETMKQAFSEETQVVLCRELTKLHEEYIRGSIKEVLDYLSEHTIKGECCLLLEHVIEEEVIAYDCDMSIVDHVNLVSEQESLTVKEAIKEVSKIRGLKKQEVYKEYHA
ncbi:16S rRNA (cytidine(1402)-2'-O)-methyltransferase [Vagococcus bubulae]|uniref:Ribosomal RNA small subunit methyltransferase I n=1 Tax=Vagococcus bubulae TaxID=1977868 RepID=A0A429ZNS4_9ENTE|nr:16S rRNA (cytidine(1402)-2'-O)-methyltransferase [Vagococcus bubulae]RST95299.1 16S rRNA (cytidine(1402)-2'-O)-methyltransferase [Vagococcus bubulae]